MEAIKCEINKDDFDNELKTIAWENKRIEEKSNPI